MKRRSKYKIRIFDSAGELNSQTAEFIIFLAEKSIAEKGNFVIALSGGETPKKLYALLAESPYREKLDWEKIIVFWGDERCVPENDRRNNAHQAKIALLDKVEIPSGNVHRVPVNFFPEKAAEEYEKTLKLFFGNKPIQFDLILLGLGENGHTASLFPRTEVLEEKDPGIREVYLEKEKNFRITMTAPMINLSKNILFLVTGRNKAEILNTVLSGAYEPYNYPAQLIEPLKGNLFWFADQAAATLLSDYKKIRKMKKQKEKPAQEKTRKQNLLKIKEEKRMLWDPKNLKRILIWKSG
jgi:6-phosphogluconolactonase